MKHPLPKSALDYQKFGAPVGQRNDSLLKAALQWRDASYSREETISDLLDRAIGDGLSESEARTTIHSAFSRGPREPIGTGCKQPALGKYSINGKSAATNAPRAKAKEYVLERVENWRMPEPLADGARTLLKTAFKPGEYVCIQTGTLKDEDDPAKGDMPAHDNGITFTFEHWMAKLDANSGDPNGFLCSSQRTGLYVCINPLTNGGRRDTNVTAYRHVLVEFDKISLQDQWQLIRKSNIPCTAIVYSGGKSIHAWVRVDAKDREEYNERVQLIYDHFKAHELDEQNKNPSRLCRLAGCERFDKRQELLAVNVGAENFTGWMAGIEIEGTGHQITVAELWDFDIENDPNCVLGQRYLCKGGSCLWIGPSGIGKSSLAMQAAIMWAMSRSFFGITPKKPLKSLFIQAENDNGDLAEMFRGVCQGLGIAKDSDAAKELGASLVFYRDTVHTSDQFAHVAARLIDKHSPDLVWGDPLLSYIGDDISQQRVCSYFLRNLINPISEQTGVVWMFLHHTGKPSQDPNAKRNWQASDYGYLGIGSSELTNWARAVNVIQQVAENTFALMLPKRGKRAGARTLNGEPTTTIYLRHSDVGISWQQIDWTQPEPKKPEKKKAAADEPSSKFLSPSAAAKAQDFDRECIENIPGEGIRSEPLLEFLAKWFDVGRSRANEHKVRLIAAGLLKKEDKMYFPVVQPSCPDAPDSAK